MLLTDQQIAINELIVAYQEAIDHYQDAADFINETGIESLFKDLSAKHQHSVKKLSMMIEELGELPRAPYAEREQLHKIFTHVKAAFSDDERKTFLMDRINNEKQIASLVDNALQLEFSADMRTYLETLQRQERQNINSLNELLSKI